VSRERPQGRDRREPGPIWARPEPGARRPRYTRDEIAAAALAIADRDGFDAVSMRNLARELGAGTMSLYHYLRTKDDLLTLMDDALMAELLVPEGGLPTGWREALTEIAQRTRAAWARHPWAIEALRGERFGPNAMRHVEQSLAAVAEMGLLPAARLEVIGMVDDYVLGFCVRDSTVRSVLYEDDGSGRDAFASLLDYVETQLASGDFPHTRALIGEGDVRANWERLANEAFRPGRFERGLERLLDGIELDLQRRRGRKGPFRRS
jgi:AcrR family transcriptional regulator